MWGFIEGGSCVLSAEFANLSAWVQDKGATLTSVHGVQFASCPCSRMTLSGAAEEESRFLFSQVGGPGHTLKMLSLPCAWAVSQGMFWGGWGQLQRGPGNLG